MSPLLEIEGLKVAYGGVPAVRGVDIHVDEGELVTLVGANGAGKTSLLAAVSGLLRPLGGRIAAGRIAYDGRQITAAPAHRTVGLGIVHVPEGREILADMSVEENLLMGGYRRRDREGLATDIDTMLGDRFPLLGARRAQRAGTLSGGEQQMLALARGLLARPRLLLLDEPSLGLAPQVVNAVFTEIETIRRDGTTVLLVEQNAHRALGLADRGYVLEAGEVVLQGSGTELLSNERVVGAYLGVPASITSGG